jgi:hypothetical protein
MKEARLISQRHFVELALDPVSYPDRSSFVQLVAALSPLGWIRCIELGIAPEGGGRLGFVVQGESSLEELRAFLCSRFGPAAILSLRSADFIARRS